MVFLTMAMILRVALFITPVFLSFRPGFRMSLVAGRHFSVTTYASASFFRRFPTFTSSSTFLTDTVSSSNYICIRFVVFVTRRQFRSSYRKVQRFFFNRLRSFFTSRFKRSRMFQVVHRLVIQVRLQSFQRMFFSNSRRFVSVIPLGNKGQGRFVGFVI